ncbi:hypothetical protein FB45DRAFT_824472 [Roridomyces roridus]|uniref:F-box domain-containing protein n=1 Tax=Roridomyces roridus TaxID=1738132 RepID=A0AAD7CC14_9AGAR|nr:hypothetical protein FB45DRAFT_824472 [Roridomyces roridus]
MPGKRGSRPVFVPPPAEDSPFSDFLAKDVIPSTNERNQIREILAEKTAHLANLNAKVPKRRTGKKVPRQLRADLDRARKFIRFHQALIAPWRRLPVEIMSEIFLFTLEVTNVNDNQNDFWNDSRNGTLLLGGICKTWRQIALSTPALWSVLSVTLHDAKHPLVWVPTWLERSRSFPVHLQVFWGDKTPLEVLDPIVSTFAAHLHHTAGLWVDGLDIEDPGLVDASYPKATFPTAKSLYAPLLNTVAADLPPGSSWDWIRAACRASPRLVRLTTSDYSNDWSPMISNLKKLHFIDPITMANALQVLENAPNLQDISFDIDGPATTTSSGQVLVMESVTRLEITSTDSLGEFLSQIALPSMTELGVHQIMQWSGPQFHEFITRSACALSVLDFYDIQLPEEALIECLNLKACHTLEGLVVSDCIPPANQLLDHLTYRTHPFPNPHLVSLELGGIHSGDGILATLIASRVAVPASLPTDAPPPARLRKLRFSFFQIAEPERDITHRRDMEELKLLEDTYPELDMAWPGRESTDLN